MANFEILTLFADPVVRRVFYKVLDSGKIRLLDLKKEGRAEEVDEAMKLLTSKHLVATTEGPVRDFVTVYPTSEGFSVARKLEPR